MIMLVPLHVRFCREKTGTASVDTNLGIQECPIRYQLFRYLLAGRWYPVTRHLTPSLLMRNATFAAADPLRTPVQRPLTLVPKNYKDCCFLFRPLRHQSFHRRLPLSGMKSGTVSPDATVCPHLRYTVFALGPREQRILQAVRFFVVFLVQSLRCIISTTRKSKR
ncbi:hypothetical protein TGVAND_243360 [Toxoplasma gondii VAND]|uniref:Uncharacterized protein n=2 Tax=Toxoplasma gondii TaxID=5811 RepID=A0A2T6IPJ2_TOXGO|nr:hypothetical protein TGVAND_243360 [Toxoplasma gondii VAND]PUA87262.1 hypothetical protein TGBR9_243360 [Toxoplasma gondii TgCATBr9]